ncbi:MAG: hypothetical protein ACRDJ3_02825 [Solirubrobacteraceae bacterium]
MSDHPGEPPIEELERRMRPGAFSRSGFLGPGERLADVLESDRRTLAALGFSTHQMAERLDALITAAEATPGRLARVDDRYDVAVELYTGFQICPWALEPDSGQCTAAGGVRHGSIDWRIRNLQSGEELRGPGLIVHLIRAHDFFEGRQSPARVDPVALARTLGMSRGPDE